MAFSNLFSKLSDVCLARPDRPACALRNDTLNVQRGRKRKSDQPGPCKKRQYQQGPPFFPNGDSKAVKFHSDYELRSGGLTKHAKKVHFKTGLNVNKQQQERRREGQRRGERHQTRNSGKHDGGGRNRNRKQVVKVQQFTPEFKEQNTLEFGGEIICRHFLFGKCIKGDGCQMKHVEPVNDVIKQHCKFYVQGCCLQGERCPFMHNSFPCKFFHGKGRCSKGEDCPFSHQPLNDLTAKLLDEVIKADNELARKSAAQPPATNKPEVAQVGHPDSPTRANDASNQLMQPFRLNFYNSAETHTGKEKPNPTEDATGAEEDAGPPSRLVPNTPSDTLHPVCFVETLPGPSLYNPLSSSLHTPPCPDGAPPSDPPAACGGSSPNLSSVPYSVDAVLRASTSQRSSALHCMPDVPGALPAKNCDNKILEKTSKKTQQEVLYDDKEPAASGKASLAEYTTERPKTDPHRPATADSSVDGDPSLRCSNDVFRSLFSSPPSVQSTRLKDSAPYTPGVRGSVNTRSETRPKYAADSVDSACAETWKTPFKRLFARNVPVSPRRLVQSNCALAESVKCQLIPASSLRSLFATPLSELGAFPPCVPPQPRQSVSSFAPQASRQPGNGAPLPSDGALSCDAKVPRAAASYRIAPAAKEGTRLLAVAVPTQRESKAETASSPRASAARQQSGVRLAPNGKNTHSWFTSVNARGSSETTRLFHGADSSTEAASNSVLKSLFLSLGPFTENAK